MTITPEEVRAICPDIDEDDIHDILVSANADHGEGAEWLPYYKLALGRLAQCAGALRGVVDKLTEDRAITMQERRVLVDAANCYRDHLFIVGAGPAHADPIVRQDVAKRVEEARRRFLNYNYKPS